MRISNQTDFGPSLLSNQDMSMLYNTFKDKHFWYICYSHMKNWYSWALTLLVILYVNYVHSNQEAFSLGCGKVVQLKENSVKYDNLRLNGWWGHYVGKLPLQKKNSSKRKLCMNYYFKLVQSFSDFCVS